MTVYRIKSISALSAYVLQEVGTDNEYRLVFEFWNVKPQVGDYLILSERILDKSRKDYCGMLCYSPDLLNPCGRKIERLNIDNSGDIAILIQDLDKGIVLKRLYG